MICCSDSIPRTHDWVRPRKCLACPVYLSGETRCYAKVDEITDNVVYDLGKLGVAMVRRGFCFDGASIPQLFWSAVGHPFSPELARAALLHDAMYHSGLLPKAQADECFRELLRADGVATWRRRGMWRAVELCGGSSYRVPQAIQEYFRQFIHIEGAQTE